MKLGAVTACGLLLLLGLGCAMPYSDWQDQFQQKTYSNSKGEHLPYCFLSPKTTETGKKYPLVIFYHGAGERGDDNKTQLTNGVQLFASAESREKFPCYMLVPQCPKGNKWVNTDWKLDAHIMPD